MKKTVRDIEKMSGKGVGYLKTGLYYLFVPLVIGMGLKTVDLSKFIQQPALWFNTLIHSQYNTLMTVWWSGGKGARFLPVALKQLPFFQLRPVVLFLTTLMLLQEGLPVVLKKHRKYLKESFWQIKLHIRFGQPLILGDTNLFLNYKTRHTANSSRSVLLPPPCFNLICKLRETSDPYSR